MVLRSQRVLVLVGVLGLSLVQAKGLVGWPGSAERTPFCRSYGCVLTSVLPPGPLGDKQNVYRMKKLPGAVMRISISTDDQSVTDANLEFRNVYYLSLSAAQKGATLAFMGAMTGLNVAFSMNECRKSPDPMVAVPPMLANDDEGHGYKMNCFSIRASDMNMNDLPGGTKAFTTTSFEVQPNY
jgi:hypothetical protein